MGHMQERGSIASKYSYGEIRPAAGYKIFVLAILISLIWHVAWLSMIKVVVVPNRTIPVKFSKVSFLGTLLSKGAGTPLTAQPREQAFLEKHYLSNLGRGPYGDNPAEKSTYVKYERRAEESHALRDQSLKGLIEMAISDVKIEPLTQ